MWECVWSVCMYVCMNSTCVYLYMCWCVFGRCVHLWCMCGGAVFDACVCIFGICIVYWVHACFGRMPVCICVSKHRESTACCEKRRFCTWGGRSWGGQHREEGPILEQEAAEEPSGEQRHNLQTRSQVMKIRRVNQPLASIPKSKMHF